MSVLGGAAGSGLLASNAEAQVARKDNEEDSAPPPLLVEVPSSLRVLVAGHSSHRSHSSHSSHSSHYSGSRGGGGGGGGDYDSSSDSSSASVYVAPEPPPPPKPAHVSFIAYPGGQIFVDGKPMGHDTTEAMRLTPGSHVVRVVNRFLGEHVETIEISEAETGARTISW